MNRIAVLVSGFGSNLQAIIDAVEGGRLPDVELALVVSNRRDAYGIKRAVRHGIPVIYFPLAPYTRSGGTREEYDADLAGIVESFDVTWVVMAGWMHVWSDAFLSRFPSRVINLHPALPGEFPGTDAIQRAYRAFQRGEIDRTGVMVHQVPDEAVDAGPVVVKEVVPIRSDDSLEELEERIHRIEHRLLVGAIHQLLCEERESAAGSSL